MEVDPRPFRLGPGPGTRVPAVLCIHGLFGTPYEVRPCAEALARAGFRCDGPLLPGHGTTPQELAGTRHEAWVEAVKGRFDVLAAAHARVYVVGLSLGGVLALRLASERPVAGLVVMAAPLRLPAHVRWITPLAMRLVDSVRRVPGILDEEARRRHPGYERMPLRAVRELQRLQDQTLRRLGRVSAPLLALYSLLDRTAPPRNGKLLLARVGSTAKRLWLFEHSAHVLPVDREGAEVARRTVEFIAALEQISVDGLGGAILGSGPTETP